MKYVIIYLSDSGSIYEEEFSTREQVDVWLKANDYKAKVIEIEGNYRIEDRT